MWKKSWKINVFSIGLVGVPLQGFARTHFTTLCHADLEKNAKELKGFPRLGVRSASYHYVLRCTYYIPWRYTMHYCVLWRATTYYDDLRRPTKSYYVFRAPLEILYYWGAVKNNLQLNITYHMNFLHTLNVLFCKGGGRKKYMSLDIVYHVSFLHTINTLFCRGGGPVYKNLIFTWFYWQQSGVSHPEKFVLGVEPKFSLSTLVVSDIRCQQMELYIFVAFC